MSLNPVLAETAGVSVVLQSAVGSLQLSCNFVAAFYATIIKIVSAYRHITHTQRCLALAHVCNL